MIRHRSRMILAAAMCLALSASVSAAATATEVAHAPSWKAPAAQSVHAMPVTVADQSSIAPVAASPSMAVVAVAVGPMIAGEVNPIPHLPREKPRLWGWPAPL